MGDRKKAVKWFYTSYGKQLARRKYYGMSRKAASNSIKELKSEGWALVRAVKTKHGYDIYAKKFF